MSKDCLIIDTNIIISNKTELNDIKQKINNYVDIYLPELVIEEVSQSTNRILKNEYDKIEELIKKNRIYKYEKKFDIQEIMELKSSNTKKYLQGFCNGNLISYKEITLDMILKRYEFKNPPFCKQDNSSDKGFKDAIIWLSILNEEKLREYRKIYFLTNDREAFIKDDKDVFLQEEFGNDKLKIIASIDELYKVYDIVTEEIKEEFEDKLEKDKFIFKEKTKEIKEMKTKLNELINRISLFNKTDKYGNDFIERRFEIKKMLTTEMVENLLMQIPHILNNAIFLKGVPPYDVFECINVKSSGEDIETEDLVELNEIYDNLKTDEFLLNSLLMFLVVELNRLYVEEDDLPF